MRNMRIWAMRLLTIAVILILSTTALFSPHLSQAQAQGCAKRFVLAVDNSSSMSPHRQKMLAMMPRVAEELIAEGGSFGIVVFGSGVEQVVDYTTDPEVVKTVVEALRYNSGTFIPAALKAAADMNPDAIVLASDGESNGQDNISTYTIGLALESSHRTNLGRWSDTVVSGNVGALVSAICEGPSVCPDDSRFTECKDPVVGYTNQDGFIIRNAQDGPRYTHLGAPSFKDVMASQLKENGHSSVYLTQRDPKTGRMLMNVVISHMGTEGDVEKFQITLPTEYILNEAHQKWYELEVWVDVETGVVVNTIYGSH